MTQDRATLDPAIPGNAVFARFREQIRALGLVVEDSWSHGTIGKGRILHDGEHLANFSFSSDRERYSFNVHPPADGATELVIQGLGRIDEIEPHWEAEQRDAVEALFRARLVERGVLGAADFPTDYALRKWVGLAATIQLPKERGDRRYQGDEVVVRPREEPGARFPAKSPDSVALVRAARLQDQSFERDRAIDLAVEAATNPLPDGDPSDPASGWLARSGRVLLRGHLKDMTAAWQANSYAKVVTGVHGERDDVRVPYESTPAASAISP